MQMQQQRLPTCHPLHAPIFTCIHWAARGAGTHVPPAAAASPPPLLWPQELVCVERLAGAAKQRYATTVLAPGNELAESDMQVGWTTRLCGRTAASK